MKAFTHLCSRVNISLMLDTITLYIKNEDVEEDIQRFASIQLIYRFLGGPHLGFIGSIDRSDPTHETYHRDDFDRDTSHYHLKFNAPIDEKKFTDIAIKFFDAGIITIEEQTRLINAYRTANNLDSSSASLAITPRNESLHGAVSANTIRGDASAAGGAGDAGAVAGTGLDTKTTITFGITQGDIIKPATIVPLVPVESVSGSKTIIYSPEELSFIEHLKQLKTKTKDLEQRALINPDKYTPAAAAARTLCTTLENELHHYCANRTQGAYAVFKTNCHVAIDSASDELHRHRGMKQVLGNLLLAIALVGVFYLGACLINKACTGKFLFFKTAAGTKLDNVAEKLDAIPAPLAVGA